MYIIDCIILLNCPHNMVNNTGLNIFSKMDLKMFLICIILLLNINCYKLSSYQYNSYILLLYDTIYMALGKDNTF